MTFFPVEEPVFIDLFPGRHQTFFVVTFKDMIGLNEVELTLIDKFGRPLGYNGYSNTIERTPFQVLFVVHRAGWVAGGMMF